MSHRLLIAISILLLVGFAVTFNSSTRHSGTEEGNLWLLTSLILGVGLIASALGTVASLLQPHQTDQSHGSHREHRGPHSTAMPARRSPDPEA